MKTDGRGKDPNNPAPPSIIGADMRISGDIRTTGDMQIEGVVDGDIQSHSVTIGKSAEINGEIMADAVRVFGRVNGRIRGKDVTIMDSARVTGDILHESLEIARGAHIEGVVKHQSVDEKAPRVNLVVSEGEPAPLPLGQRPTTAPTV